MKIDLNELETVQQCLNNKQINESKPSMAISLLAKYYLSKDMDKKQIVDNIDHFMNESYHEYNSATWIDTVEKIVSNVIKYNSKLVIIKNINITRNELDYVKKIDKLTYQKLAFVFLVYAKIFNQIKENNNNWVEGKYRNEMFFDAKVNELGKNQLKILHDMVKLNIIFMAKNITNNSINVSNYIDDSSEIILKITDFRELGLQYLKLIGYDKIKKCEECGKLIKYNSKKIPKYCTKCAKEKHNEVKRNWWNNNH